MLLVGRANDRAMGSEEDSTIDLKNELFLSLSACYSRKCPASQRIRKKPFRTSHRKPPVLTFAHFPPIIFQEPFGRIKFIDTKIAEQT
jgi:hypothetical protein